MTMTSFYSTRQNQNHAKPTIVEDDKDTLDYIDPMFNGSFRLGKTTDKRVLIFFKTVTCIIDIEDLIMKILKSETNWRTKKCGSPK